MMTGPRGHEGKKQTANDNRGETQEKAGIPACHDGSGRPLGSGSSNRETRNPIQSKHVSINGGVTQSPSWPQHLKRNQKRLKLLQYNRFDRSKEHT